MRCDQCDQLLAQRLIEALDPRDQDTLEVHLSTCESCSASGEDYQELAGGFASLQDRLGRMNPGFVFAPESRSVSRADPRRFIMKLACGSLAAAALILLVFWPVDLVVPVVSPKQALWDYSAQRLARAYRTAPVLPSEMGSSASLGRTTPRLVRFTPSLGRSSSVPSLVRSKSPSMLHKIRRRTNVYQLEKPRSRGGRGTADSRLGFGKRRWPQTSA